MKIFKRLGALIERVRTAADRRLDRAMTCPQCQHNQHNASAECKCWDAGCLCVVLHESRYH